MKFRVILACVLFALCAPAQSMDDSAMYLQFFHEAAHRPEAAPGQPISTVNGIPANYTGPTLEDTLGITSDQAHSLVKIGLLCVNDVASLDDSMRSLIFESRLELADSNKISEAVAARLKELEAKRIQIVLNSVQQMKVSLGERFKAVDDYIRAHAGGGFFPMTGPTKKL